MLIGVTACTARRNSRQESLFITCPICSLTAYTQWVKHFSTLAEPTKKHAFILCKHFADTYLLATPLGVLKSWHAVCLSCHFQQWHLECMLRLLRWLLQLNFFCSALFCFVLFQHLFPRKRNCKSSVNTGKLERGPIFLFFFFFPDLAYTKEKKPFHLDYGHNF